eukprot:8398796-Pyramimonas_sp.AAC.1
MVHSEPAASQTVRQSELDGPLAKRGSVLHPLQAKKSESQTVRQTVRARWPTRNPLQARQSDSQTVRARRSTRGTQDSLAPAASQTVGQSDSRTVSQRGGGRAGGPHRLREAEGEVADLLRLSQPVHPLAQVEKQRGVRLQPVPPVTRLMPVSSTACERPVSQSDRFQGAFFYSRIRNQECGRCGHS